MKTIFTLIILLIPSYSQIPEWVQDHFDMMTKNEGIWIAENTYKSENEPFDQYQFKWEKGWSKNSIDGYLYALKAGKVVRTVWRFHMYWHPIEKKLISNQFGRDGSIGIGTMTHIDGHDVEIDETFYFSNETRLRLIHTITFKDDEMHSKAFTLKDGKRQEIRYDIWKNMSS